MRQRSSVVTEGYGSKRDVSVIHRYDPPQPEFIHMTGRDEFNTILPNDFSFCEDLDTIIQEEPIDYPDPETRRLLRSIRIVRGEPFTQDDRMRGVSSPML